MEFKVHYTNEKYESWTVQQFLEHELSAVKELHANTGDTFYLYIIEYLEKRLSGEIQ